MGKWSQMSQKSQMDQIGQMGWKGQICQIRQKVWMSEVSDIYWMGQDMTNVVISKQRITHYGMNPNSQLNQKHLTFHS